MSTPDPARQPGDEPAHHTTQGDGGSPPSSSAPRFAGVGNGRVVITSDSLDEVVARLDEVGADRQHVEIWEADPESGKILYAWSCRRIPAERAGQLPGRTVFPDNPVQQRNEALARKINEEARSNPNSPYAGKFVGILNGQVAVVADSWEELGRKFRPLISDPAEAYCVEASRDYDEVMDIG